VFRLATLVGCAALCLALASVGVVEAKPARPGAATAVPASAVLAAAPVAPRPGVNAGTGTATPGVNRTKRTEPTKHPAPHLPGCPSGLVALTFDDGPRPGTTGRLVRELRALHAPATFFMVGSRVQEYPRLARLVARSGFEVANHTWDHARLTLIADPGVRRELRRTSRALRAAGVHPTDLGRPPYGAVSPRVRTDFRDLGLRPVLWTIDSRDWAGGSSAQIAARILAAVRPHATNIVLQHDGVDNSPNSVRAVPTVVHALRHRGYCLAGLSPRGLPIRPAATSPAAPARR
jgi:peptidoglycan/xylan/chitin deacetylase (PgdA/CDA1 family)